MRNAILGNDLKAMCESLRRRTNAQDISFRISLRWLIHIINPVDKTKLSCNTRADAAPQFLYKLTPLRLCVLSTISLDTRTRIRAQIPVPRYTLSSSLKTVLGLKQISIFWYCMSFFAKKGGDDITQPDRKLSKPPGERYFGFLRLTAITQDSFHAWLHDSGNLRNT